MKHLAITIALLAITLPVFGHHSFAAEYDNDKPIKITGTVTKVEWMNPHAHIYVDTQDAAGKATNWEFELGSPNGLMRSGWNRNSLKAGDPITVEGFQAKDGSNLANARSIMFNGRKMFAGNPDSSSEK